MHTFIDSICTIGKLNYNELMSNIMNDNKIVNPEIFPYSKNQNQAHNQKKLLALLTTELMF